MEQLRNGQDRRATVNQLLADVEKDLQDVGNELEPLLKRRVALEKESEFLRSLLDAYRTGQTEQKGYSRKRTTGSMTSYVVDRVLEILNEVEEPLHIQTILQRYSERGFEVPGAGGTGNLISHMRRSPRIKRVSRGFYEPAAEGSDDS